MTLFWELVCGTLLLVLCAMIHVGCVAASLPVFGHLRLRFTKMASAPLNAMLLGFVLLVVVAAHTIEIWIWAASLFALAAFETFEPAFYFAMISYTTLGYGDELLPSGLRIFGSFAAVTGMLMFGISTAFLVDVLTRLSPRQND